MAATGYSTYGVLAGRNIIKTTGQTLTAVYGNVGANIGTTGPGAITSSETIYITGVDTALLNAQNDYTTFLNLPFTTTAPEPELGGITYTPGVIQVPFPATLSSSITLNGNSGTYTFQINGTLTVNSSSGNIDYILLNGAVPSIVYWIITGNVLSLGSNSVNFPGIIMTPGNITLGPNCIDNGGVIAFNSSSDITVNNNTVRSFSDQFNFDKAVNSYINIKSNIADTNSIRINAANAAGGINISAGTGGIAVSTTNAIIMTAQATFNLIVNGSGTLGLQNQFPGGLVDIDALGGINIGTGSLVNTPIINIGNSSAATSVVVNTGTGGFNVITNTGGTISLNAVGASSNLTLETTGNGQDLSIASTTATVPFASRIVITSVGSGGDAIFLNTAGTGGITASTGTAGGMSLNTGSVGFTVNTTNNGPVSLNSNGGDVEITAGGGGISLDTGISGGLYGIGHVGDGEVQIGTFTGYQRTVTLANSAAATTVVQRWGPTGSLIQVQQPQITNYDSTGTIASSDLLIRLIKSNPSTVGGITLTLPNAGGTGGLVPAMKDISGGPSSIINDSLDFSIINTGSVTITLATTTIIGNPVINPSITGSGSGLFRIQLTNVTTGSEAFTLIRLS
ncbi:MAG: hypothetical protein Hyperionvirus21_17 [Hyperionvirus sp.]|uniref:DUF3494 domain-containing protein n=1 Tax=Hyperionvirus sp. TaxID=2487770 RepID=A0A3G5AEI1_9VIRU|nr:MAG: hypothetical protein Hyperionvirus21_17 [Hyperionvirus sp.]